MVQVEYHPNGYPQLGLVAHSLKLRFRPDASLRRLRRRLEDWEATRGNPYFEARGLERLPVPLAFELAHVYTALREWHPEVRPDWVDFKAPLEGKTLGLAASYAGESALREAADEVGVETFTDLLVELKHWDGDPELARAAMQAVQVAIREPASLRIHQLGATGSISLDGQFASARRYRELLEYWERRNARAAERGRPRRVPPLAVSAASYVLCHEFGHLLDDTIAELGLKVAEPVYARLSQALLGGRRPRLTQWGRHLMNYPTDHDLLPGPHMGGRARQRIVRRALKDTIAYQLGSYAPTNRDELFAESFALAYCAGDRALRTRLRPLRDALVAVGLGRSCAPKPRRAG